MRNKESVLSGGLGVFNGDDAWSQAMMHVASLLSLSFFVFHLDANQERLRCLPRRIDLEFITKRNRFTTILLFKLVFSSHPTFSSNIGAATLESYAFKNIDGQNRRVIKFYIKIWPFGDGKEDILIAAIVISVGVILQPSWHCLYWPREGRFPFTNTLLLAVFHCCGLSRHTKMPCFSRPL